MLYRVRLARSENDGNKYEYLINGKIRPTLELKEDKTYTFEIHTPGYPFYFANNDGQALSNPMDNGTINFIVKEHDPDNCHYECSTVKGMGNNIIKKKSTSPRNGYEADHDMYSHKNTSNDWEEVKVTNFSKLKF